MDYAGFDCKITVPLQSPIRHRDGELWTTCKRRRSLKRSLETAKVKGLSLGGSVVAILTNPSSIHPIIDYRGYSNYLPQKQAPAIFAKAAFFIFK